MIANDDITFDKYYIENAVDIIKNTDKSFLVESIKMMKKSINYSVSMTKMDVLFKIIIQILK